MKVFRVSIEGILLFSTSRANQYLRDYQQLVIR